jgi:hypothetical protein
MIAPLRSARIALGKPPTSSSLEDEEHVPSLLLSTAARDPKSHFSACPVRPARMSETKVNLGSWRSA